MRQNHIGRNTIIRSWANTSFYRVILVPITKRSSLICSYEDDVHIRMHSFLIKNNIIRTQPDRTKKQHSLPPKLGSVFFYLSPATSSQINEAHYMVVLNQKQLKQYKCNFCTSSFHLVNLSPTKALWNDIFKGALQKT